MNATRRFQRFFVGVGILFLVGCQKANTFQPPPPPTVTVAKPVVQTVTDYLEETGTTEASDYAQVRARVRGFLEEIQFEPNQEIKKGDVLYKIEKDIYEAALEQANAELAQSNASIAQANASLAVANAELKRADEQFKTAQRLVQRNALSREEYDNREAAFGVAKAEVERANSEILSAKARVAKAEAAKADATIDLRYTTVESPIDGQVDKTNVYVGNLVGDGEATHLTTVVNFDPMFATFSISERALLNIIGQRDEKRDKKTVRMFLGREIDKGYPIAGHLNYYDTAVDESTGTYLVRGEFPNPGERPSLLPGLFVRIRVPVGEIENAILIPERAVASDQLGRYVLVVNSENEVERRDVQLGTKLDSMIVVRDGLKSTDRLVVDGVQRARVGAKVTPKEIELTPPKDDTGRYDAPFQPPPETETDPMSDPEIEQPVRAEKRSN